MVRSINSHLIHDSQKLVLCDMLIFGDVKILADLFEVDSFYLD
jgi:hypothetical protein